MVQNIIALICLNLQNYILGCTFRSHVILHVENVNVKEQLNFYACLPSFPQRIIFTQIIPNIL